jgi:large subunit ribosomal protein L47
VRVQVKKTMRAIKHVLTERFYTWEDARELAKQDPEIDLSGKGPTYIPLAGDDFVEEYVGEEPEAMTEGQPAEERRAGEETREAIDIQGRASPHPTVSEPEIASETTSATHKS